MPWHALPRPSLSLAVLRGACAAEGLPVPDTYHGGLRFAEYLLDVSGGRLTPYEYHAVSEAGWTHALGDWVFAGALYDTEFGLEGMHEYASRNELPLRSVAAMRDHASDFVDLVVDELLALDPELVGFTTTFMQNVPSLAVARRLKSRRPDITVLFGGGNCDGPMGAALHREFPFVDLVLRGESDEIFPALLRALGGGGGGGGSVGPAADAADDAADALAAIPGLCRRDVQGRQLVSERPARLVPPARMARPDFDDWFAAFDRSPITRYMEPELVVESARGCWWGEHHHCTFCGLNGTSMAYRAKAPETFTGELDRLVRRHKVLDIVVVDNILEPGYLRTALPDLAARGWDGHLHYEVKANLTTSQINVLSQAGVHSVQPGIESLIDDVLARMDKGVRAVHNVRTMRDCESAQLEVSWNWLYGFPGEAEEDYRAVQVQIPALVHLQPPASTARIELNRFSPYFEDRSLGFPDRRPAEPYRHVYDIPQERLADLVYRFDTSARGLTEEQAVPLHEAVEAWIGAYPSSSLHQQEVGDCVIVRDRRAGWPNADHVLETPTERHAWRELAHGRSLPGLLRRLADADLAWRPEQLMRWLNELLERGLVFTEGGRWIALATADIAGGEDGSAETPASRRRLSLV
jgi:ribosomal peptide maturation radical SAM protein 1